mmetsp:Transcript_5503/g.18499  ORF Transcript_5503/g.18499 Transcript_5503/m.18499 type:complete len:222 (-) Transcript_5503:766-1431(-)
MFSIENCVLKRMRCYFFDFLLDLDAFASPSVDLRLDFFLSFLSLAVVFFTSSSSLSSPASSLLSSASSILMSTTGTCRPRSEQMRPIALVALGGNAGALDICFAHASTTASTSRTDLMATSLSKRSSDSMNTALCLQKSARVFLFLYGAPMPAAMDDEISFIDFVEIFASLGYRFLLDWMTGMINFVNASNRKNSARALDFSVSNETNPNNSGRSAAASAG